MKKYFIILLIVSLLVAISFVYKMQKSQILFHFPVTKIKLKAEIENPLYLLLFFSKKNCNDCLEIIDVINGLSAPFVVYGVVPVEELENEKELREKTGAAFELLDTGKFKKYTPLYGPTLMGITGKGRIVLLIPGVPNQKNYLENFLNTFYNKAYQVLLF